MKPLAVTLLLLSVHGCTRPNDTATTRPPASASVIALSDAPTRVSPTGTGQVQILGQGQQAFVARLRLEPQAKVPLHRDESEEYIHVLSGSGVMMLDGKTYELSSGSTVFMPANAEVSFQNGPEPFEAIQVFAPVKSAEKYSAWSAKRP